MKRVVFAISVLFSVFLTMHAQVSKLSPFVREAASPPALTHTPMLSTSDFPNREGVAPLTPTGGVVTFSRGETFMNDSNSNSLTLNSHQLPPPPTGSLPAKSDVDNIGVCSGGGRGTITAFIRTTDIPALCSEGCQIYAQWDDICIASIPLDKISKLASMPSVKRIEAGRSCMVGPDPSPALPMEGVGKSHSSRGGGSVYNGKSNSSLSMYNRNSNSLTLNSHQLPPPPTGSLTHTPMLLTSDFPMGEGGGRGSIIGIVDIGFDLTHPTLFTPDMADYRVKRMWDMLDNSDNGEAVVGDNDTIYVGRQYIGTEAILNKQRSTDGLIETHGTHCIGTAAGSGIASESSILYRGMCPNADICIVSNYTSENKSLVSTEDTYKYTTATDMLAFKYIFDYAESVGKPCVINFSEGSPEDLYESVLYGEVLSKMIGPGRIICSAAGNEGAGDGTYMHKPKGKDSAGAFIAKWATNSVAYALSSTHPAEMTFTFYKDGVKVLDWQYDCTKLSQFPDSVYQDTIMVRNEKYAISLNTYPSCFDENKFATDISLTDLQHDRLGYATPISLTISGRDNDMELFACGGYLVKNNLDASLSDFECTHNVFFPGCVNDVICVGATSYVESVENRYGYIVGKDYGLNGIRAGYSSIGPTNSGLIKPDIMAPGTNIVSAFNHFWRDHIAADEQHSYEVTSTVIDGIDYPWGISTGTSMSCPMVTGIIGLWLQVCPTLTPDQIKDVFAHTSSHYAKSLDYPNNYYGYGEINALAGIEYIKSNYTGIEDHSINEIDVNQMIYNINGIKTNTPNRHGIYIINDGKNIRKVVK